MKATLDSTLRQTWTLLIILRSQGLLVLIDNPALIGRGTQ